MAQIKYAVIHQPHFLPWLGYFNKASNADLFVFQDNVQFRRRYFQNRTYIRNSQGLPIWFSIPIHANQKTLIKDVVIADKDWNTKLLKIIKHSYSNKKHFLENWEFFQREISIQNSKYLLEINYNLLTSLFEFLDIELTTKFSRVYIKQKDAASDLVHICLHNDVSHYIFGEGGGMKYHGMSLFKANNINTVQQKFKKKFVECNKRIYPQSFQMSIIDYLFTIGRQRTIDLVKNTWRV